MAVTTVLAGALQETAGRPPVSGLLWFLVVVLLCMLAAWAWGRRK